MIYKRALICTTKNLFSSSTEIGTLSGGYGPIATRNFEENKWYVGLTPNNYYEPNRILNYEITESHVIVEVSKNSIGFGLGRAFKCEPNQTYSFSTTGYIAAGYYDADSNTLGNTLGNRKLTFTTPDNCKWFTIVLRPDTHSTINKQVYEEIQLEKGTTPTSYVPYGYLQSYKKAIKVSNIMQVISKPINGAGTELAGTTSTVNGITCEYLADGTGVTLTGTATAITVFDYFTFWKPVSGHKYLWLYGRENRGESKAYFEIKWTDKNGVGHWFNGEERIYTLSPTAAEGYATRIDFHLIVPPGQTCNGFTWHPQCFDLTEMYGAGNEPTTVEEFRQKYPNDLYPYRPYCFVDSYKKYLKIKENNNA